MVGRKKGDDDDDDDDGTWGTHCHGIPIHGFQLLGRGLEPALGEKRVRVGTVNGLVVRDHRRRDAHARARLDEVAAQLHAAFGNDAFQG